MKMPKHYGKCRICGEDKVLTLEHVPPQKAYNSNTVVKYSFEQAINMIGDSDRLPWDNSGIKGKYCQGGNSDYLLCRECNNNTGSWYMEEYVKFTLILGNMIQIENFKEREYYNFTLYDLSPLKLFKAVITMMCDTNHNCLGYERLRKFLLDKESNDFDTEKYQLYAFLVSPESMRITGIAAEIIKNINEPICFSEVSHYPIGFVLYINKPKDYKPFGINVNELVKHKYDENGDIGFYGMPYVTLNSKLPIDFRTKDEIERCIKYSEEYN